MLFKLFDFFHDSFRTIDFAYIKGFEDYDSYAGHNPKFDSDESIEYEEH